MNFELGEVEQHLDDVRLELVQYALGEIARKYGIGSDNHKPYHDENHTLFMIDAAHQIATERGVSPSVYGNIIITAAFHDIEQDKGPDNESFSADIAVQKMDEHPDEFTDEDKLMVRSLIMATKVRIANNTIYQLENIPENERTVGHYIIADADLASMGREPKIYWQRAECLLREFNAGKEIDEFTKRKFAKDQTEFLANHHFWLPESAKIFHYKNENIAYADNIANGIAA